MFGNDVVDDGDANDDADIDPDDDEAAAVMS